MEKDKVSNHFIDNAQQLEQNLVFSSNELKRLTDLFAVFIQVDRRLNLTKKYEK